MGKIVFVCAHLGDGGAERVMSILINYFVQNEYDVKLIMYGESRIDYDISDRVKIIELYKYKGSIKSQLKKLYLLRKEIKGLKTISFLYEPILYTVLAGVFNNTKTLVSERSNPAMYPEGKLSRLLRNVCYRLADRIVFQTSDARLYFGGKIQEKSCVIENPINDELYKISKTSYENRIVSVCRLHKMKNIEMSIDAFDKLVREYPHFVFEIYGEGDWRSNIENYISQKKLDGKVQLKGYVKNVHNEIKDAMIYVSSSNYEGLSNSMLESMAIGIPTICTDCPSGGARATITSGENGFLVPVGDSDELYKRMKELIDSEELRMKFSENGRKVLRRFSRETICKEWKKQVDNL